jgi:MSHA pilin protein MshC
MRDLNSHSGFTLLELVTIVVLLGIVSVVAISNLNTNTFSEAGFEQELRSAIRFAQKFAIVSGCDVEVNVNAGAESYALNIRNGVTPGNPSSCIGAIGAFGQALNNPTGGVFAGTAPDGVDITAGLTFVYGADGVPSASGVITVSGQNITIEPTGYVR